MAEDTSTTRHRRREPASPRTLRTWRSIGLLAGPPGAVLMVAGVVVGVADPAPGQGIAAVLLAGSGLLCALVAVTFLQRVWGEPLQPHTRWTTIGHRLAAAFWGLWSLGVLLNFLHVVFEVGVPAVVRTGIGLLVVAAFLALLLVAFRIPAVEQT